MKSVLALVAVVVMAFEPQQTLAQASNVPPVEVMQISLALMCDKNNVDPRTDWSSIAEKFWTEYSDQLRDKFIAIGSPIDEPGIARLKNDVWAADQNVDDPAAMSALRSMCDDLKKLAPLGQAVR